MPRKKAANSTKKTKGTSKKKKPVAKNAKKPTAKKTTAKKPKKERKEKKVKNLSQTHGREETFQPTTLEQIWGDTGMYKYNTLEETEYQEQLKNMTKADIRALASKIGLVPIYDRGRLTKRLLKEFQIFASKYKKPLKSKNKDISTLPVEVRKILEEGR